MILFTLIFSLVCSGSVSASINDTTEAERAVTTTTTPTTITTSTNKTDNETATTEPEATTPITTSTNKTDNETATTEPEATTSTTTTTTTKTSTDTIAPDGEQNKKPATLIVQSRIINNCEPMNLCDDINNEDFSVNITTSEGKEIQVPGFVQSWAVYLFPDLDGLQYYVSQENDAEFSHLISLNTTFSESCHGSIEQLEIRKCMINNELNGNNVPAKLKVITRVENNCKPPSDCSYIHDNDFMTKVLVFDQNTLKQKVKPFPGDNEGWTVYFFPEQFSSTQWPPYGEGIQYKVEQEIQDMPSLEGLIANTTYSHDCRSVIDRGSSRNCTIINSLLGSST